MSNQNRKQDNNGFVNPLAIAEMPKDEEDVEAAAHVNKNGDLEQIEVSLVEDPVEPEEAMNNAVDFLVENNENFRLSWDEASHRISELQEDPSRPPVPGWNWDYVRFRLRRCIENLYFRIFTMLLIVIDLILVSVDLATGRNESVSSLQIIDLLISVYFVVEIILRIVALTMPIFFATWWNALDFAVVLSTFVVSVCVVSVSNSSWAGAFALLTALRFVRIFRLVRLYTEKKQIETAARQLISQNKRRYQQDGFDLDLTYVTSRVIATSFPSSGLWSLYRNPIEKVAKFLDSKHSGHYKIFNLCSERTYDTSFFHHRVERICIDDHNVPSLEDMLTFAKDVKEWLNEDADNVIVVHCKGGKGRTGTMICVWLIESGIISNAEASLEYFGQRRTDTNVSKKFQGVETPSQSRYVGYFEQMKRHLDGRLPPSEPVVLKRMEITGMMYVGHGDGSDFWFNIHPGRESRIFSAHLGFKRNCNVDYNPEKDILSADILNCPTLDGDVRILFHTSNRSVPLGYENCPFYFWFNTYFVVHNSRGVADKKPGEASLVLTRDQLDNPHKSKTWFCFRENFKVKLYFESVANGNNN